MPQVHTTVEPFQAGFNLASGRVATIIQICSDCTEGTFFIVMTCVVWGQVWRGQVVHAHSDNKAVVVVKNSVISDIPNYAPGLLPFPCAGSMGHLIACLPYPRSVADGNITW